MTGIARRGRPGIVVSVIGDDGLGHLYAHMSSLAPHIREAVRIAACDPIGPSGNSGFERATWVPHLHFGMQWGESEDALLRALHPPWYDVGHDPLAFRANPLPFLLQSFEEYLATKETHASTP